MSIDLVTKMWSRRSGGDVSQDGRTYTAQFTEGYQVSHSPDATIPEILDALPVAIGDTYAGTTGVYCKTRNVEAVGPVFSTVLVGYSGEVGPAGFADSPLSKPPTINWTNAKSNEAIDTDGYGFAIVNTNGEPVAGQSKDVSDFVLTVRRNFESINMPAIATYLDSVNSDTFAGWLPGQGALDTFSADAVFDEATSYWDITAKIIFRIPFNTTPARAWWCRYRNEGNYVRYGTKVTFTGGGGIGAAGYAIAASGVITKVVVTSRGRDYTAAPTVGFTSTTGGASAAGTAVLNDNLEVASVTITNGGTGYKSGIERAVDKNKEPVTTPVLLKANGEYEPDASAAVWLERPLKTYRLPYSALGLL